MPAWYTPAVRARYRTMWSIAGEPDADGAPTHGMTGGCNLYRATPLHPPRPDEARKPLPDPASWRVNVPVRVIWGAKDLALKTGLVDGLDAVCDDIEIVRIREGSHWIVHEQPERIARLIRGFL